MKLNMVKIQVRFHEADPFNVAHHSRYFQWFDLGMLNFFENILDLGTQKMAQAGFFIPVVEDYCAYSRACSFGDELMLITFLETKDKPIFTMHHNFVRASGNQPIARGWSRHIFVNKNKKLMPRTPRVFKEKMEISRITHPDYFR